MSRADLRPILLVSAFVLALFAQAVFGGRTLYENDLSHLWAPQTEVFVRTIESGAWPVWNPYAGFGQPMLANANYQVLYPPTWLNLVLVPSSALTTLVVAHLVAAGIGLYVFLRKLDCGRAASACGASLWIGSGPLLSLLCRWNHFMAAAWVPWVLVGCLGSSRRALLGAAVAAAAQLLAGSPEMFATSAFAALVLAARPGPGLPARVARALIALVLAVGLGAVQLLPSWSLARRSERSLAAMPERVPGSAHPAVLAQTLWPLPFDQLPLHASLRQELFDGREPFLESLYLGLAALPFAALGFVAAGRWRGFLVVVMGTSLLGALGTHTPAYGVVAGLLPPLGMVRFPVKAALAVSFVWAVACALGLEAALRGRVPRGVSALGAAVTAGAWGLFAATRWSPALFGPLLAPEADFLAALRTAGIALLAAASTATLGLVLLNRAGRAAPLAAALLALGDLWIQNRGINETADPAVFRGMPAAAAALRLHGAPRIYVSERHEAGTLGPPLAPPPRVLAPAEWSRSLAFAAARQSLLLPPIGSRFGLRGSFDPDIILVEPPYVRQLYAVCRRGEGTPAFLRLLQLGAVERVVALHDAPGPGLVLDQSVASSSYDAPIRIWRVSDARPRAYVVGVSHSLDGLPALERLLGADFEPAREVVVAGAPGLRGDGFVGRARFLDDRPDRLRIEAALSQAGYLVVADAFDPAWRASVGGAAVPVLRANVAFRAVPLAAGDHDLEMSYWPEGLNAGLSLSGLSVLLAAALWWSSGRSQRPA